MTVSETLLSAVDSPSPALSGAEKEFLEREGDDTGLEYLKRPASSPCNEDVEDAEDSLRLNGGLGGLRDMSCEGNL